MVDFKMPSLGADMEDGTLTEWRVKTGERVKRGDIIAEVETQKGVIEIEIFEEGVVEELLIQPGQKVKVGTVVARIRTEGEPEIKNETAAKTTAEQPLVTEKKLAAAVKASPLAKRLAQEKGIDLSHIKGSGPDGAITKEDVDNFVAGQTSPTQTSVTDFSASIRQAVAAAMARSKREIPHYYLQADIDLQKTLAHLQAYNEGVESRKRLLPAAYIIKAVALALEKVPALNGTWENTFLPKQEIHVGFVVSLRTGGLMIPAVKNANTLTVPQIMDSLNDLIPRARALKLRSSELSDSTFTITSLGDEGVELVYGVIYPPQVGIAGFGSVIEKVVANNGKPEVRPVITATLSADHRATDGAVGSKFLKWVTHYLQNPEEL